MIGAPIVGKPIPRTVFVRCAFSLIELVLVIVIIAIVASMAVPRYARFIASQRVESAARRIALDLNMTGRRAQQASAARTIIFDATAEVYRIPGSPGMDHAGDDYVVDLSQPPYQVDIVSANFGGDAQLRFTGFGDPDSDGTVRIQSGPFVRDVTVNAVTGKVDVQ
jgi:prepilin-type N-terminal cleavage/methylation domain-containing protein